MENIVEIKNLSKKFGKFGALNQVNFDVKKAEILGFIGPNGSGKSTTIRTLLGILKPTSGYAKIFGMDVWHQSVDIHKRIAYVPGDVNLWPNLSGGEIIDVFLSLRNQKRTALTEELIKKFDLDVSKKARSYSKGNRQKIALITALSSDADLYIFDEPTSGLDPLMEQVFQECVLKLKKDGKSVLLSSHILSEVEKLCDRIAIIKEGKIIETGSLDEMRHLTRTSISVKTENEIIGLDKQEGVYNIEYENDNVIMQVNTQCLNSVIMYLARFNIISLLSTPLTLEDLFIRYYESSEKVGE